MLEYSLSESLNKCRKGVFSLTEEDKAFLERIGAYADEVMADMDTNPEKTRISVQLDKLRPIMEEIAKEQNSSVEDIFIKYMDLASEASIETQRKFQNTVGNMTNYGDVHFVD